MACIAVPRDQHVDLFGFDGFTYAEGLTFIENLNYGTNTAARIAIGILQRIVNLPEYATKEQVFAQISSQDEKLLLVLITRAMEAFILISRLPEQKSLTVKNGTSERMNVMMKLLDQAHIPLSIVLTFGRELGIGDCDYNAFAEIISSGSLDVDDINSTLYYMQVALLREPENAKRSFRTTITHVTRALHKCGIEDIKIVHDIAELQLLRQCAIALTLSPIIFEESKTKAVWDGARTWRNLLKSRGGDDPESLVRVFETLCKLSLLKNGGDREQEIREKLYEQQISSV